MIQAVTQHVRFMRALQSPPFALLWAGQTVSRLGDGAFSTALAWQVLRMTGSGTAMGLVLVASSIPRLVFLLVGGVAADRLPRRLVLLCSDVGSAAAVLLIAILARFNLLQLWHLIALSFCFGTASGFFFPTYQSISPELVVTDRLPSANALNALSRQIGTLLGPLLGAALVAFTGATSAFAFDGLTFVVSAICILAMRRFSLARTVSPATLSAATSDLPEHMLPNEETQENLSSKSRGVKRVLVDVREGLSYVTRSPWLWVTILIASVVNIGISGPLSVALPKLVHDVYRTGVWLLGFLTAANAIGSIGGSIGMGQLKHPHRRGLLAYTGTAFMGIGILLFGLPVSTTIAPLVSTVGSLFIGVGEAVFGVIWVTVLQELVPTDKQGRVFSIDALGSFCLLPIGYVLTGILTDQLGPAWVFFAGGILTLILTGIALCVPEIRNLD